MGSTSAIIALAHTRTGNTARRVEIPAERSGRSSLLRCIQATVNIPASRTTDSHRRSKMKNVL